MIKITSTSEAQTFEEGKKFGAKLLPGSIIAFSGSLGAGKTCFIKGICNFFKVKDNVNSPTFTLINSYLSGTLPIHHFDFYRLKSVDELFVIGYEECFYSDGISLVEWSEKFPEVFDGDAIKIDIKILNENQREIRIS